MGCDTNPPQRTSLVQLPGDTMQIPSTPAAPVAPTPFYRSLYFQVIIAIVLGVLLGYFEPKYGAALKPLGDAF